MRFFTEEARSELDEILIDARAASADHETGIMLEALAHSAQKTDSDGDERTRERDEFLRHLSVDAPPPVPIQA